LLFFEYEYEYERGIEYEHEYEHEHDGDRAARYRDSHPFPVAGVPGFGGAKRVSSRLVFGGAPRKRVTVPKR